MNGTGSRTFVIPGTAGGHARSVQSAHGTDRTGYVVRLFSASDGRRLEWEAALDARGASIGLRDRAAWRSVDPAAGAVFGVVVDATGRPCLGFGAGMGRSRAYPGFGIVRVERFGGSSSPAAAQVAIRQLTRWVRRNRVLRLHVEVHSMSATLRDAIGTECRRLGFRRSPMRSYARTVLVDLLPEPESIFAGLHATARRHIRAVEKKPVAIRVIDDTRYAKRMNALIRESFERTGARSKRHRFADLIRFARCHPHHARVVGLFRTDLDGPDALLAFAAGYCHGIQTEYGVAGGTRRSDLKLPLMYGLAWDLILWGRSQGSRWFDFGGVVDAESGSAMGGIADFKRYFAKNSVEVGEEWVYEPHPMRSAVARHVTSIVRRFGASRLSRGFARADRSSFDCDLSV